MPKDYLDVLTAAVQSAKLSPSEIVVPEDCWVTLNGIRFHYLDWGNAHLPHLVLLHGGSLTAHTFDLAVLLLRDKYHCIALSQRGHGDTEWTPEADREKNNQDLMLEDVRQFIDYLDYDKLALVGMSMGGLNAIRYASRYPEKLSHLGIVDVGPDAMTDGLIEMEQFRTNTQTLASFEDFLGQAVKFMPHRAVAHLEYSLTHSLKQQDDGSYTWKQDNRSPVSYIAEGEKKEANEARAALLWQDLESIKTPTCLFRGANTKIFSVQTMEKMMAVLDNVQAVEIPDATHNVHSDNPKRWAAELNNFLKD
ncbi:MAG: alpha/beta hydrolase [Pseudomonadales bacterium]|nr:alpha/beta hydrolase [Pseudomonadales bacterium]